MEEMIISLVLPMMQVRYTRGPQLFYKDHIVNFLQDISIVAIRLPRLPEDTETVIIRRDSVDMSRHVDFIVRRDKVLAALQYKIANDPNYSGMQIDYEALTQLPENGSVAHRIPTCRAGRQNNGHPPEAAGHPPEAAGPAEAAAVPDGPVRDANEVDDDTNENNNLEDLEQHVTGVLNLGAGGSSELSAVRAGAEQVVNGGEHPMYSQTNIVSGSPHEHH